MDRGVTSPVFILTVLAICYLSLQPADTCTCAPSHPSVQFCKSHFVVKAKVKNMKLVTVTETLGTRTYNFTRRQYGVKISKVFKGAAPGMEVGKYVRFLTSEHGSLCGVTMKNETMYVIPGYLDENNNSQPLDICNPPREWFRLPESMRNGYRYLYNKSCGCKPLRCYKGEDCGLEEENEGFCMNNPTSDVDRCFREHAVCLNDGQGSCKWSTRALFRKCMRHVKKTGTDRFEWEP